MKLRKVLSMVLIAVLAVTLAAGCGSKSAAPAGDKPQQDAAKPITLKVSYPSADRGFVPDMQKWWASEVEKRSNGRIKIAYYWGGLLGKTTDILYAIQKGTTDVGTIFPLYFPQDLPLATMNGAMVSTHKNDLVATSKAWWDLQKEYPMMSSEWEKYNQKLMLAYDAGPYTWFSKKPIKTFGDLAGMKIGPWGGEAAMQLVKDMGSVSVSMSSTEVYDAMNKGTMDGRAEGPSIVITYKHYEIAKHITDVGVGVLGAPVYALSINMDTWKSLPKDLQDMILKVNEDFWPMFEKKARETQFEDLDVLKEKGVNFHIFTDTDKKKVAELPVYSKYKAGYIERLNKAGMPGEKVWNRHFELIEKYSNTPESKQFDEKWNSYFK